jgi:hypothetical protein
VAKHQRQAFAHGSICSSVVGQTRAHKENKRDRHAPLEARVFLYDFFTNYLPHFYGEAFTLGNSAFGT